MRLRGAGPEAAAPSIGDVSPGSSVRGTDSIRGADHRIPHGSSPADAHPDSNSPVPPSEEMANEKACARGLLGAALERASWNRPWVAGGSPALPCSPETPTGFAGEEPSLDATARDWWSRPSPFATCCRQRGSAARTTRVPSLRCYPLCRHSKGPAGGRAATCPGLDNLPSGCRSATRHSTDSDPGQLPMDSSAEAEHPGRTRSAHGSMDVEHRVSGATSPGHGSLLSMREAYPARVQQAPSTLADRSPTRQYGCAFRGRVWVALGNPPVPGIDPCAVRMRLVHSGIGVRPARFVPVGADLPKEMPPYQSPDLQAAESRADEHRTRRSRISVPSPSPAGACRQKNRKLVHDDCRPRAADPAFGRRSNPFPASQSASCGPIGLEGRHVRHRVAILDPVLLWADERSCWPTAPAQESPTISRARNT